MKNTEEQSVIDKVGLISRRDVLLGLFEPCKRLCKDLWVSM